VANHPRGVAEAPDAALLNLARGGEAEAWEILRRRHESAVRRLVQLLVPSADVDDVVAEAFTRAREAVLSGGGPGDAFRLYVLGVARHVSHDRLESHQAPQDSPGADPGERSADLAAGSLGQRLIGRQFQSLPERWIAVLWQTEIEGASPADAAQILGLAPEEAALIQRQALDGLRQASLLAYISGLARPECDRVADRLGLFVWDLAAGRERLMVTVTEHLDGCEECRGVCSDLADISSTLRQAVAPVFLGDAAASYLNATREAGATTDTPTVAAPATAGAAPGRLGHLLRGPGRWRWATAGAAGVLLAAALIIGLSLSPHDTLLPRTARHQAAPTLDPVQTQQRTQPPGTRTPTPGPTSPRPDTVSSSPASARPAAANASPSPSGPLPDSPSPPAASAAQLSATVAITNQDPEGNDESAVEAEVAFDVTNTGNAATGVVDVTLTGAPLSSVVSGGWTCQATDSGATCQDSAIPAGSQAQETLILRTFTETPCGEPVDLTAVSGEAQASAQSAQVMDC
jgi:DNA-directed RNA polymerase specialized sigma24 family protein